MRGNLIVLVFLISAKLCTGQNQSNSQAALHAKYISILSHLKLDTLHGEINALYTHGYQVRAKTVHKLLENCGRFYNQQFPGIVFNPQVLILDSAAWATITSQIPNSIGVYGLPDAEPAVNMIFIPADKKAVARLVGMQDNLPDSLLSSFDYISLHELGHIFLHTYEHTDTKKKWADEFLASYFAICYLKQIDSRLGLPQVDDSGWIPTYKTLESFEKLYEDVGPRNYAWYQGKFQKLGTELYPRFQIKLLKLFIANFSDTGKKTDPLVLLKQLAPGIVNHWLMEMKPEKSN